MGCHRRLIGFALGLSRLESIVDRGSKTIKNLILPNNLRGFGVLG
jgi:hypothetical protein